MEALVTFCDPCHHFFSFTERKNSTKWKSVVAKCWSTRAWPVSLRATATWHTRESRLNATPGWEAGMDILAVNMVLPTLFRDKLDCQVFQVFG